MRRRLLSPALVAILTSYFAALALATTSARYAPGHTMLILVLYLLFATTLWLVASLLARLGRLPCLLGALGLSTAIVWHLREQTMIPERLPGFVAAVGVGALMFWFLLSWLEDRRPVRLVAIGSLISIAMLGCALALTYLYRPTMRWHLLRHNKILGSPLYIAIGERVAPIAEQLWSQARPITDAAKLQDIPRPAAKGGTASPSIVVLMIDTLRADSFAAYGGSPDLMPRFNRLAETSIVFSDVTANASYTKSSVASLFTGLLPEEHGAVDHGYRLPSAWTTLAEAFEQRGYLTAAFVSNYANVGRAAGFDQGFAHFAELKTADSPYMRAEDVNRIVLDWIEEDRPRRSSPTAKPLFLYVHYLDPHAPYLSGWQTPSARHAALRRGYDNELRYIDSTIPTLVEDLESELPNARILVTSDHGEEFGEHEEWGHGHALYRELVAVPAILRGPGIRPERVEGRFESRDFFDLLLRLSDPGPFEPADWARGNARDVRYAAQYIDRAGGALHRPDRAFTCTRSLEKDGTLLIWSAYGQTVEVYDQLSDPHGWINRAHAHPESVATMRRELENHPRRWTERIAVENDPDTIEMLRQLGYLQ